MSALEFIVMAVCLLGSWFFSGIETGLISINRLRLRHFVRRRVPGADILQRRGKMRRRRGHVVAVEALAVGLVHEAPYLV